jgi:hypothetical protein
MTFYKNTEVIVLEASASLSKVRLVGQEDYQAVWVPNRLLEQRNGGCTTLGTVPPVTPKLPDVGIVTVQEALVPFVKRLRILHAPKASTYLQEQASKQGVILDARTRPINVGENSKGIRSAAAEIEFSKDTPTNILPNGYKTRPNGCYRVNSLAVAFALLKAGAKQTAFA